MQTGTILDIKQGGMVWLAFWGTSVTILFTILSLEVNVIHQGYSSADHYCSSKHLPIPALALQNH